MQQFEHFKASELYCPRCHQSQPVRERLLLVLPHAELYEYRCTVCAASLGSREVTAPPLAAARPPRRIPSPHPARGQPPARPGPPRGLLR
ncbi:MAG: hypothetical protein NTV49_12320 [Kiritimatiellaeota bacterium]|nr:hypothetical protein [Kiritimatiellota bacterium]